MNARKSRLARQAAYAQAVKSDLWAKCRESIPLRVKLFTPWKVTALTGQLYALNLASWTKGAKIQLLTGAVERDAADRRRFLHAQRSAFYARQREREETAMASFAKALEARESSEAP